MTKKLGITLGIIGAVLIMGIVIITMYVTINDKANGLYQSIPGLKAKVEATHTALNSEILQTSSVVKGEKDAFLEFQRLVADSKKGQTLGGIMTQIQEKYPTFQIKGFEKLQTLIEEKRDEFVLVQTQYNDRVVAYNSYIVGKVHQVFLPDTVKTLPQFVISTVETNEAMKTGKEEVKEIQF